MARKQGPGGKFVTALTKKLAAAIVADVARGLFDAQIAMKNGLDVTTLKSWVERGIDEDAEEPFSSFAEAYILAAIALEEKTVGTILSAADPWDSRKRSTEESSFSGGANADDCDSRDSEPRPYSSKKTKRERASHRGDWKAAAWFLERRWPLRWGLTRQPEGGPKEAIKLPEASQSRKRRVDEMTQAPPPELIKAFHRAGYDIVRRPEPK
jgi:hypothetical protein